MLYNYFCYRYLNISKMFVFFERLVNKYRKGYWYFNCFIFMDNRFYIIGIYFRIFNFNLFMINIRFFC